MAVDKDDFSFFSMWELSLIFVSYGLSSLFVVWCPMLLSGVLSNMLGSNNIYSFNFRYLVRGIVNCTFHDISNFEVKTSSVRSGIKHSRKRLTSLILKSVEGEIGRASCRE